MPQEKETSKRQHPTGVDIGVDTGMAVLDMEDIIPDITDTDTAGAGRTTATMVMDGHIMVTMDIGGDRIQTTFFIR